MEAKPHVGRPTAPGLSPSSAVTATAAPYPPPGTRDPPRLPPLPGLKVRVPLCLGFLLSLAVRVANANAVGGVTTDASLFAAFPTLLTVRSTHHKGRHFAGSNARILRVLVFHVWLNSPPPPPSTLCHAHTACPLGLLDPGGD
jgi:hypothetical protein